jgi:hypothetical protein
MAAYELYLSSGHYLPGYNQDLSAGPSNVEKSKAYTFDLMEHQKDSIIRYYLNSFV